MEERGWGWDKGDGWDGRWVEFGGKSDGKSKVNFNGFGGDLDSVGWY